MTSDPLLSGEVDEIGLERMTILVTILATILGTILMTILACDE